MLLCEPTASLPLTGLSPESFMSLVKIYVSLSLGPFTSKTWMYSCWTIRVTKQFLESS